MGIFRRGPSQSDADRRQLAEDIERIAKGGIPLAAEQRLSALTGGATAFTSDLSVNEFVLAKSCGLEPVAQVMGSSVYHVGWQYLSAGIWGTSQEIRALTDAYNTALARAADRLSQEAELANADAVVGVRVTAGRYDWSNDLIEFMLIGTAVRAPALRTPAGPALTNLSGQDCWLLLTHGHRPCGLVGATSVQYGPLMTWGQSFPTGSWGMLGNVEYAGATQTWYAARHAVMGRLAQRCAAIGADGIVGTQWTQHERPQEANDRVVGVTYTLHALATAIATGDTNPQAVDTVLPM
jgi:uncharacterized protein YbjQ (UPF0145 family)